MEEGVDVKFANVCGDHFNSRLEIPWGMWHAHLWVLPLPFLQYFHLHLHLHKPIWPLDEKRLRICFFNTFEWGRGPVRRCIHSSYVLRISCQSAKSMICGAIVYGDQFWESHVMRMSLTCACSCVTWWKIAVYHNQTTCEWDLFNTHNWCQSGHNLKLCSFVNQRRSISSAISRV